MAFYQLDEIRRAANGRWPELLTAVGLPADVLDGRNHPCPKCGGRDRFAAFADFSQRGAVHCRRCFTRGCEISPSDGIATLRWWLNLSFTVALSHLGDALGVAPLQVRSDSPSAMWRSSIRSLDKGTKPTPKQIESHTAFARDAYQRMTRPLRERLAQSLLVTPFALTSLRVGITPDGRCSTWPMRNEHRDVVGVRIVGLPWTDAASAKWSRKESHSGMFMPRETPPSNRHAFNSPTLFLTEGASDTAAAISLGWNVVGRASCSSSTGFVCQWLAISRPETLIVITDNDAPGRDGGKRLARTICQSDSPIVTEIQLLSPPADYNDLRDWVGGGVNEFDLDDGVRIANFKPQRQTTFQFS